MAARKKRRSTKRRYRKTAARKRVLRARKQCKGSGSRRAYWSCVKTELSGGPPKFGKHRRRRR